MTSSLENRIAITECPDKVRGSNLGLRHYRTQIAFEIAKRLNLRKSATQTKGNQTLLAMSKALKEVESEPEEPSMSFSGRRALSAAIYKSIRKQRSAPIECVVTNAANSLALAGSVE
ncbi:unnamed protein product [Hydatigera taeniaeformis]|uniref:Uncharacterized protein n=1 Tax=Hydatigena taeniaeformis TaxID=6205 RepID=A0A0R3WZF1_HYDTA|nr:unnamed protein product [Hydatigera taeniaeformis]